MSDKVTLSASSLEELEEKIKDFSQGREIKNRVVNSDFEKGEHVAEVYFATAGGKRLLMEG